MPLGEDESKVKRWALFSTNSAMNFNKGVVTCSIKRGKFENMTHHKLSKKTRMKPNLAGHTCKEIKCLQSPEDMKSRDKVEREKTKTL